MNTLPFRVIAIAFAGALVAHAAESSNPEFRQLIDSYWQAWSSLDPDKAAPMYVKDGDAVFFDVAPLKYTGWDQYKDGVKKVFANATSAKFVANDDLKSSRSGNMAWTSETFHGEVGQKDGKTMELNGRHTAIWAKRGGKWLIVHEHVSAPLPE
jgi:ketosteroid isomerase-like protein